MHPLHARSTRLVTLASLAALGAAWLAACGSDKDPVETATTTAQAGGATTATGSGGGSATGSGGATASSAASSGAGGSEGADLATLGEACSDDTACGSGHCTEGVCCDTAATDCNGCKSCNLDGSKGTCGNKANGTACGMDQVCGAGSCVACKEGEACTTNPGAPCKTGVIACGSGMPVCVDGGNAPAATACGAQKLQVCDGKGACNLASCTGKLQFKKDDYTTGANPQYLVASDLNADGKLDLAVSNFGSATVSVFLNKGNGIFQAKSDFAVGMSPAQVKAADMNGDGQTDLVVANAASKTVSLLKGAGNGSFAVTHFSSMSSAYGMTTGDYTGDGRPDIVAGKYLLVQKADETFQPPFPIDALQYLVDPVPLHIETLDINTDSKLDFAYTVFGATVGLGLGNGMFTLKSGVYLNDYYTGSVVVADLNADGKSDLAVPDGQNSAVAVGLGKGDGSFQPSIIVPTQALPSGVSAADVNGDGYADLLVSSLNLSQVSVHLGKGDGTFASKLDFASIVARANATGDFNGDGKVDLAAVGSSGLTVHLAGECTP
jgi:hypothetical protein